MLLLHNVKVRYLHEFGLDLKYGIGKIMFCTEQKRLLVSTYERQDFDQSWGTGSACFWASRIRIRIHESEVQILAK